MHSSPVLAFLLLTSALSAVHSRGAVAQDISELFDPASLARGICKPFQTETGAPNAFMQLAAATPGPAIASRPQLRRDLGDLTFKVTTASAEAQAYFDQGLRLTYGFNHAEAIRAFKAGQELDPTCAMCFWGEALALGPNINLAMPSEANVPALAAIARAQQLKSRVTKKEQALIDALAQRYSADPAAKRADLDQAFFDAMSRVQADYPDDPDVSMITVEAAMDLSPWAYWQEGGREPLGAMATGYPMLERVMARHPNHPGAIHYYIHVMEQSAWPEKAEAPADRLGALMPGAGHMVHMPSHIYFVRGRYKDSLDANIAAVAADEAYFATAASDPIYRNGYYTHNIHFALESAAFAGDARTTLAMADKLMAAIPADKLRAIPMAQPIGIAPYLAHVRFSDVKTVMALPDPGDDVPYMKGLWHYVRGSALALGGDQRAATRELNALIALQQDADFTTIEAAGVPAGAILEVAEHVLSARIAAAKGDWAGAVTALEAAVEGQDNLPYMEPAYWYYPARQSLGVALLKAGRAQEAVEVLRRSLIDAPHNGWALHALAAASKAAGDERGAAEYAKLFAKAWIGPQPPELGRI
jgi:tetratricopeptide (TPR) repeat protein